MSQTLNFEAFLERHIDISTMLSYFGIYDNDALLSLYNMDDGHNAIQDVKNKSKLNKESLYMSPDISHDSHYEQLSEHDPNYIKMLNQVMH